METPKLEDCRAPEGECLSQLGCANKCVYTGPPPSNYPNLSDLARAFPHITTELDEVQPELPGVESTLAERGARYGPFKEHARVTENTLNALMDSKNWLLLPPEMRHAWRVIADKAGRMLSGDFSYTDNWHDIQGYAKLGEDCAKRLTEGE